MSSIIQLNELISLIEDYNNVLDHNIQNIDLDLDTFHELKISNPTNISMSILQPLEIILRLIYDIKTLINIDYFRNNLINIHDKMIGSFIDINSGGCYVSGNQFREFFDLVKSHKNIDLDIIKQIFNDVDIIRKPTIYLNGMCGGLIKLRNIMNHPNQTKLSFSIENINSNKIVKLIVSHSDYSTSLSSSDLLYENLVLYIHDSIRELLIFSKQLSDLM